MRVLTRADPLNMDINVQENVRNDIWGSPTFVHNTQDWGQRRRRRSSLTSDHLDSSNRSKSDRTSVRRTASQERKYRATANIVDLICPLAINKTREAASNYSHYNGLLISTSELKTFILNCEPFVARGNLTMLQKFWTVFAKSTCWSLSKSSCVCLKMSSR